MADETDMKPDAGMVLDVPKVKRRKKNALPPITDTLAANELLREQCYENWYMQGLSGRPRSMEITAAEFSVPVEQIQKWAKEFNWQERTENRAAQIARKMDTEAVQKVADIKMGYFKSIDSIVKKWLEVRFGGDIGNAMLTLAMMEPETIIKLIRLNLTLLGEPETIKAIEGTVKHRVDDSIAELSAEDLRNILKERERRKKALPSADVTVTAEKVEPVESEKK